MEWARKRARRVLGLVRGDKSDVFEMVVRPKTTYERVRGHLLGRQREQPSYNTTINPHQYLPQSCLAH
jgi:hypothetical protein